MTNLRKFINDLDRICTEAEGSGHTRNYPPEIHFYIDGQQFDLLRLENFEIDTSNAVCCGDIIGATLTFRLEDERL